MEDTLYPPPNVIEADEISDAMWDILNNGATTLPPSYNPDQWIYWLKRYASFEVVQVVSHTEVALILEGW